MKQETERTSELGQEQSFQMPDCILAGNVCGECYYNDGGWCRRHGGWVDYDKWACSSFA